MFQGSFIKKPNVWLLLIISATLVTGIFFILDFKKTVLPAHNLSVIKHAVLQEFLANKSGDLDKFTYVLNDKENIIHFPPHTASLIMKDFKRGDIVDMTYEAGRHGPKPLAELVSISKADKVLMIKSVHPPAPNLSDSISVALEIFSLQKDGQENVIGIISDKYFIPIPPHLLNFPNTNSSPISVAGYVRDPKAGFVNIYGLIFLKPYSITINNTHYIL